MKIASRDQRITDYNEAYPIKIEDAVTRVEQYFTDRGWNLKKAAKKAAKKASFIVDKREYRSIHILMYEYPMKTDRPRTFNGHTFSPNAAANKDYFRKALTKIISTLQLITTPAEILIDAYLEMPSRVPPDEVILFEAKLLNPIDRPDYDNIEKCYTDMLTSVITTDDDIFYHAEITKYYSLLPRVDITIRYLNKHESDYIYKKIKGRKSIKEGIASGQIVLEKLTDT